MCDMWDEWEGMREIVAEQQAQGEAGSIRHGWLILGRSSPLGID